MSTIPSLFALSRAAGVSRNTDAATRHDAESRLYDSLRHCAPDTYEAACAVRAAGDAASLHSLVASVVGPFVSTDLQPSLATGQPGLRLAEDLGIDSLSLMEIAMVSEDTLLAPIGNHELSGVRTLGDLEALFERLLRSQPRSGTRLPSERGAEASADLVPLPDAVRLLPTHHVEPRS